jgi:hypothetical protein
MPDYSRTADAVLAAARGASRDAHNNVLGHTLAATLRAMADAKPMGRWGADDLRGLADTLADMTTGASIRATARGRDDDATEHRPVTIILRTTAGPQAAGALRRIAADGRFFVGNYDVPCNAIDQIVADGVMLRLHPSGWRSLVLDALAADDATIRVGRHGAPIPVTMIRTANTEGDRRG